MSHSFDNLQRAKMNLSFAGCGFLGIYHVGVASCIREYAPHVLVDKIAGASAGALAAAALICGVPLGESTSDVLRVVMKARSRALGPFHPGFDLNKILYDGLAKNLPDDAHILCTGYLHVSCTRVSDGQNVLLTQFNSKDDLIQALLCSCFIPFYSGIVPLKFHGVAYMDGGLSDNLPILDENTITVSPFSGESDICPQDNYFNFLAINIANTSISFSPNNLYRAARILFPPPPDVLTKMCQQGFDDALKFLQRNNMISCTRCLAVQSSFVVSEETEEEQIPIQLEVASLPSTSIMLPEEEELTTEHEYDGCEDCRHKQQMALYNGLPDSVSTAIQDACDQLNKGVVNWLFRHRPIKLLSLLTVPYILPIDITIVVLCKLWELVPKIRKEMESSFWNLIGFAKNFVHKFDKNRHLYSAKFSCQLAITEYNYAGEDKMVTYTSKTPVPSRKTSRVSSPMPPAISVSHRSRSMEELAVRHSKLHRKSYAGTSNVTLKQHSLPRRLSVVDRPATPGSINGPERVISTMNFGFTMDLSQHKSKAAATAAGAGRFKDKRHHILEAFKSLDEEERTSEMSMIELANKAMHIEREYLSGAGSGGQQKQPDLIADTTHEADTFEDILDVTNKHEALMAFYYLDEENRVKVTEIFNVTDADTSAVLGDDERETNANLTWDNDWRCEELVQDDMMPTIEYFKPSRLDQSLDSTFDLDDADECNDEGTRPSRPGSSVATATDFLEDLEREMNAAGKVDAVYGGGDVVVGLKRRKRSFAIARN